MNHASSAIYSNDLEALKKALNQGEDLHEQDAFGQNLLHLAVGESKKKNSLECVAELLSRGVDVNALSYQGDSALIFATSKGHHDSVKLLLSHGADPHALSSRGFTPLMIAARFGNADHVKQLLAVVDPNQKGREGRTALNEAIESSESLESSQIAIATHLITISDLRQTDKEGFTPLMRAANGFLKSIEQEAALKLCIEELIRADPDGVKLKAPHDKNALQIAIDASERTSAGRLEVALVLVDPTLKGASFIGVADLLSSQLTGYCFANQLSQKIAKHLPAPKGEKEKDRYVELLCQMVERDWEVGVDLLLAKCPIEQLDQSVTKTNGQMRSNPLIRAVSRRNLSLTKKLFTPVALMAWDDKDETALKKAWRKGSPEIHSFLLAKTEQYAVDGVTAHGIEMRTGLGRPRI